ncbi:hypothetical protein [Sinorhizobium psoraleae]|uniref:hypothetical protein n=1 Tax=Sinorhizobium psoraleae TaxID=520838 RepID=UPI0022AF5BF0|nr:hypothetical protein [Sinorhizobium psoraleae]
MQDKIASASGAAVKATAEPARAVSEAVAQTTQKVEELGRVITVHTSDGAKPVQQVFELVNGVAQAAGESKTQLEGVTTAAGETAAAVKEITATIAGIPALSSPVKPGQEQGEEQGNLSSQNSEIVRSVRERKDRMEAEMKKGEAA